MLHLILKTIRGMDTPVQWSAGLSIGFAVGLIPYWSGFAWLLTLILILSGANLLTGSAGYFIGTVASASAGPALTSVGLYWSTCDWLQPLWASIHDFPLGAWLFLDDPQVMGGIAAAVVTTLPVFLVACAIARPTRNFLNTLFSRFSLTRWLCDSNSFPAQMEAFQ